jgi:RNA polymerase sigma-70 factor (ECF subfamily)
VELAGIFGAEVVAAGGDPGVLGADAAGLEARLSALLERGRSALPELEVNDEDFVAHLARVVAPQGADGPSLEELEIEDLYLAHACVVGAPGAAEAFDARCGERLRAAVASATKSDDERREMEQRLRQLLLVGSELEPPRLSTFRGHGPLARWITVVAQRQIVNAIRSEQAERQAREGAAQEAAVLEAVVHPEVAFLKERYKTAFEEAVSGALAKLPERERLVLRLHLVKGVTVVQIGQMYGVSHSTVSRWLADARDVISTQVTEFMRAHAGLAPSELRSLAGLVASQLDLSMSRLLG